MTKQPDLSREDAIKIIRVALVVAIGLLGFVYFIVQPSFSEEEMKIIRIFLIGFAILDILALIFLPKIMKVLAEKPDAENNSSNDDVLLS